MDISTVITIASGKGGTGKTTTAGAIASCLAALGYKTLCLDCDIGLKNLDMTLGLSDVAITDFTDIIDGRFSLEDAVIEHPAIENLFFLGAPSGILPENVSSEEMRNLIGEIRESFDYCIIDSPAGIGQGFRLSVADSDLVIVVANSDATSLRDSQRTVSELLDMGIENIRLIVNRVRPRIFKRVKSTVDDIIDAVGARLIGIVSEDESVIIASATEKPLILTESKRAAKQFLNITYRILGKNVPISKSI